MRAKAPQTFKQLQAEWYQKIANSGFQEIEQPDGNLKLWASTFFKVRYQENVFRAKEEYYRLAGQFLNDYKFESKFEHRVWELHTEGVSIRNITLIMKKQGFKTYKRMVHETIGRLAHHMVIKSTPGKQDDVD